VSCVSSLDETELESVDSDTLELTELLCSELLELSFFFFFFLCFFFLAASALSCASFLAFLMLSAFRELAL